MPFATLQNKDLLGRYVNLYKDVLYILTVKCNDAKCEEDLEFHKIEKTDETYG
jgi:hypothetical protein